MTSRAAPEAPRRRHPILAALALSIGVALALLTAELALRAWPPALIAEAGLEARLPSDHHFQPDKNQYRLDPGLGYLPRLGEGRYTELGTVRNDYATEKPPGVERILFLGDSVTHRGLIIEALRRQLGDAGREFWNAGVEAYGTAQEVQYFERFGLPLAPDRVILTFHLNDFEVTPALFLDDDGQVVVFLPKQPRKVDPRLFKHSYLYRCYLGYGMLRSNGASAEAGMAQEIQGALRRLRDECRVADIRLQVLVMPLLGPTDDLPEAWREGIPRRLARISEILEGLGIEHLDLSDAHGAALAAGLDVRESPADPMHPSPAAAHFFAEAMLAAGWFGPR